MKIWQKENEKLKTMARLFFKIWIRLTYFAISQAVDVRFLLHFYHCLFIRFPMPYFKLFYCKNSRRYSEKNVKRGRHKKHCFFNDSLRFTEDHFPQEQKISGYNTSHLQSNSLMPYRNIFFFKDLNMKTLLKKSKNMTQQY